MKTGGPGSGNRRHSSCRSTRRRRSRGLPSSCGASSSRASWVGSSPRPRRWTRRSARGCAAIRSRARASRPPRGTWKRLGATWDWPSSSPSDSASVPCGVALGIPEDRHPATLTRHVYDALTQGYRRVKIKVAPGWDEAAVGAARQGMAGTDVPLTIDANGAYDWPVHERNLRLLDEAGLLYIEQPLAPDELVGHARLGRALKTPICLDETVKSVAWARQIAELDGPKIWNIKVHRVGGLTEVCRIYR